MRSFVALREVHLGLQPDHVLVARLPLPVDRYKTADQVAGFYRPLLQRLKHCPVSWKLQKTSTLPPYGGIPSDTSRFPARRTGKNGTPCFSLSAREYFPVLKIQFVDGRSFTEAEVSGARQLAIVNQTFVKQIFGE